MKGKIQFLFFEISHSGKDNNKVQHSEPIYSQGKCFGWDLLTNIPIKICKLSNVLPILQVIYFVYNL